MKIRWPFVLRSTLDHALHIAQSSEEMRLDMRGRLLSARQKVDELEAKYNTTINNAYKTIDDLRKQLADKAGDPAASKVIENERTRTDVRIRSIKMVNRDLRNVIARMIVSVEELASRSPNQVTAEHLRELAAAAGDARQHTGLAPGEFELTPEKLREELTTLVEEDRHAAQA